MPLAPFPPEQENTQRVVGGQRTYRLTTPERTMVVNDKTFGVDEDNRFEPLARLQVLSEFTSPNAQSGGSIPDCSQYWANDVFSRFSVHVVSVRLNGFHISPNGTFPFPVTTQMPTFSEFQLRGAFSGVSTVLATLSLGAAKALVPGDVLGLLATCSGAMGCNEIEIWGRIPTVAANAAQTNASPYSIVFGIALEMWPTTTTGVTLGKFVTAIP